MLNVLKRSACAVVVLGLTVTAAARPAAPAGDDASPQAASALADLLSVCNDALQFNPAYRAARADFRVAGDLIHQATGKLLPQVGVRAQYDWINEKISGNYYGL